MPNELYKKYAKLQHSAKGKTVLNLIAKYESRAGQLGYNEKDGGEIINDLSKFPEGIGTNGRSSAFGRYKFTERTWKDASNALGLKDMSPMNQDIAAMWLADQTGALQDFDKGDLENGIYKLGKKWQALPINKDNDAIGEPGTKSIMTVVEAKNEYLKQINKHRADYASKEDKKAVSDKYIAQVRDIKARKLPKSDEDLLLQNVYKDAYLNGNAELFNRIIEYRNNVKIKQLNDKITEHQTNGGSFNQAGEFVYKDVFGKEKNQKPFIETYGLKRFKTDNLGFKEVPDASAPPVNETGTVPSDGTGGSGTGTSSTDNSKLAINQPNGDLSKANKATTMMDGFLEEPEFSDPKFQYSPGKHKVPFDAIAGLASAMIGIDAGNVSINHRDEQISEGLLNYAAELEQIKNIGLSPEIEGDLKMKLKDAYQVGLENLVHASNGHRNEVLGNQGQLDNARIQGLVGMAAMDSDRRDKAMAAYGEVQKYISDFNANRDIANNERDYKEIEKKQLAGSMLAQKGMESVMKSLQYERENGPGSANDMWKQHMMFAISGVNKNAKPGEVGSAEYFSKIQEATQQKYSESEKAKNFMLTLSPEQRAALGDEMGKNPAFNFKTNKNLTADQFKEMAGKFLGTNTGKKHFEIENNAMDPFQSVGLSNDHKGPTLDSYGDSGVVTKTQGKLNADGTISLTDAEINNPINGSTNQQKSAHSPDYNIAHANWMDSISPEKFAEYQVTLGDESGDGRNVKSFNSLENKWLRDNDNLYMNPNNPEMTNFEKNKVNFNLEDNIFKPIPMLDINSTFSDKSISQYMNSGQKNIQHEASDYSSSKQSSKHSSGFKAKYNH